MSGRRGAKQRRIVLALPRLDRWYFSTILAAAHRELERDGLVITLRVVDDGPDRQALWSELLTLDRDDDGALLIDVHLSSEHAERLRGANVVTVGELTGVFPSVTIDDENGAALALEHLLELGHRRIAYLGRSTGTERVTFSSHARQHAYSRLLAEQGIDIDPELTLLRPATIPDGIEAAGVLFGRDEPPTAVFAACDELALGALRSARDLGLDVPDDVSIVGFDDQPAALAADLTTVRQPVDELGRRGARLLLDLFDGSRSDILDHRLPVELVTRSTTAPAH